MKTSHVSHENRCFWTAPALTGGLLLLVFAVFGFFPFGGKSISWCDMTQQVMPLTGTFGRILRGEGSLLFDSAAAGGMNFWGVFFFFLASPLNLPAALAPLEWLPYVMNLLLLVKMMLCAFTAALFFRRFFPEMGTLPISLFGVLYGFSGFALNYYQNIVWLDMMALFPLLLLSLTALVTDRKMLPFVLAFSAMLTVNYYLSYMVVLFLILGMGLFFYFCSSPKRSGEYALLLGTGALASLLITAPVWLPSLLEVENSARGVGLIQSLSAGNWLTGLSTTLPVLFCGAPLASLFFLRKRQARSGFFTSLMGTIFLLLLPVILDPINKMWHTGSYQSFPVRYGYMLNFLLLLFAAEILSRQLSPEDAAPSTRLWAKIVFPLLLLTFTGGIFYALSYRLDTLAVYTKRLWGDKGSFRGLLLFLLVSVLILTLTLFAYKKRQLSRKFAAALLTLTVLLESFFGAGVYIGSVDQSLTNYQAMSDLKGRIPDEGFYRLKTERKFFAVNFFSAMGYESLSHYTSLTAESYLTSIRKLGYSGYWMEVNSNGGTAFSDALLGNRYILRRLKDAAEASILSDATLYWNHYYLLQRLPFALPSALVTDAEPGFLSELPNTASRIDMQQALADALFDGAEGLFTRHTPDAGSDSMEMTYTIPVEGTRILYFDCAAAPSTRINPSINKSCRITVNGEPIRGEFPTQSENGILELGTFTDETVTITVERLKSVKPTYYGVYSLDTALLETLCEKAEGSELSVHGNRITVSCKAKEGQTLFLPISYDKGFKATVNGKEVPLSKAAGAFLTLPLSEGKNEIRLTYTPPGLHAGLFLMAAGLLLLLWFLWKGKNWCLSKQELCKTALFLFAAVFIAVLLLIYLMPVAVHLMAKLSK